MEKRIPLSAAFAAAFLLVTSLTMVIVVARCRRTAGENPARVLGGE